MATSTHHDLTHAEGQLVERPHIQIRFQHGIPSQVGINGCRLQDVLDVVIDQLNAFQTGSLPCEENALALEHLHAAQSALEARVRRRMEQGVFATLNPHVNVRTEDEHHDFSATGG